MSPRIIDLIPHLSEIAELQTGDAGTKIHRWEDDDEPRFVKFPNRKQRRRMRKVRRQRNVYPQGAA